MYGLCRRLKSRIWSADFAQKCFGREITVIIKLSDEQKKQLAQEVRAFYLDVRGEEIGIIEEQQIIDLFCEYMAPIVYNRALDDAQRFFKMQMDNLEADFYLLYKNMR